MVVTFPQPIYPVFYKDPSSAPNGTLHGWLPSINHVPIIPASPMEPSLLGNLSSPPVGSPLPQTGAAYARPVRWGKSRGFVCGVQPATAPG